MKNAIPLGEKRASDALRIQWLAWMGRTKTRTLDALAALGSPRPTTDADRRQMINCVFPSVEEAWDYIEKDALLGVISASEILRNAEGRVEEARGKVVERAEELRRARALRLEWGV